jgi:translation elongation factor P/translation initiation factor 5A
MRFWKHFIDMEMYNDKEISTFLQNNEYSQITVYLRDGKNKKEIIKENGSERIVDDDYDNISFSDRFVQWVTVVARK